MAVWQRETALLDPGPELWQRKVSFLQSNHAECRAHKSATGAVGTICTLTHLQRRPFRRELYTQECELLGRQHICWLCQQYFLCTEKDERVSVSPIYR